MPRERGFTLVEVLAVIAVSVTLAAITVPSAASVRRSLGEDAGARKLALVLRAAQARAQARQCVVRVTVGADGSYSVVERRSGADGFSQAEAVVSEGVIGTSVSGNYIAGAVEFGPRGWPLAAGSPTPRAGTYAVGKHRVVLQLGGCVRCL